MDDEIRDYYFPADDDDLDEAIDPPRTFEFVPLTQRIEALHHACDSAKRLDGTQYWTRAHKTLDQMLDDIIGR